MSFVREDTTKYLASEYTTFATQLPFVGGEEDAAERCATDNGADTAVDGTNERSNYVGDREGGGVIPYLLFPSTNMGDCEDNNNDDDSDVIPDHDYHVKGINIASMGAGDGKLATCNGVLDGWILEDGELRTRDNVDDNESIKKCGGFS